MGREPCSNVWGRRLMLWRLWVQIPVPYTVCTFFTFIFCKNWNVWKDEGMIKNTVGVGDANQRYHNSAISYLGDVNVKQPSCLHWLKMPLDMSDCYGIRLKLCFEVRSVYNNRDYFASLGEVSLHCSANLLYDWLDSAALACWLYILVEYKPE